MEPGLARMMYYGCNMGAGMATATISALLSIGSAIFYKPNKSNSSREEQAAAQAKHASFFVKGEGDSVSLYRLYLAYEKAKEETADESTTDIDDISVLSDVFDGLQIKEDTSIDNVIDISLVGTSENVADSVKMGFASGGGLVVEEEDNFIDEENDDQSVLSEITEGTDTTTDSLSIELAMEISEEIKEVIYYYRW
jgi:hypothetical protein